MTWEVKQFQSGSVAITNGIIAMHPDSLKVFYKQPLGMTDAEYEDWRLRWAKWMVMALNSVPEPDTSSAEFGYE